MPLTHQGIPASQLLAAIREEQVTHVVTVPDWVQLSLHSLLDQEAETIDLINASNENQCITISTGLVASGLKPLLVMQNQGLYNCINTIRAICIDAKIPQVFMVGQFGREFSNFDKSPLDSNRSMVRILEPVLDALDIEFLYLNNVSDIGNVSKAYDLAESSKSACVLIVGQPLLWE